MLHWQIKRIISTQCTNSVAPAMIQMRIMSQPHKLWMFFVVWFFHFEINLASVVFGLLYSFLPTSFRLQLRVDWVEEARKKSSNNIKKWQGVVFPHLSTLLSTERWRAVVADASIMTPPSRKWGYGKRWLTPCFSWSFKKARYLINCYRIFMWFGKVYSILEFFSL